MGYQIKTLRFQDAWAPDCLPHVLSCHAPTLALLDSLVSATAGPSRCPWNTSRSAQNVLQSTIGLDMPCPMPLQIMPCFCPFLCMIYHPLYVVRLDLALANDQVATSATVEGVSAWHPVGGMFCRTWQAVAADPTEAVSFMECRPHRLLILPWLRAIICW